MRDYLSDVVDIHCATQDLEALSVDEESGSEQPMAPFALLFVLHVRAACFACGIVSYGCGGAWLAAGAIPTKQGGNPFARLFGKAGAAISGDESFPLKRALRKRGVADAPSILPMKKAEDEDLDGEDNPAWQSVLLARNVHRPTAQYYIDHMVDGFIELHGDRAFADDGAIVGGIGWIDGIPVTVIAEEEGVRFASAYCAQFWLPSALKAIARACA